MLALFLTEARKHLAALQQAADAGLADRAATAAATAALGGLRAGARLADPTALAGLIAVAESLREAITNKAPDALGGLQAALPALTQACTELEQHGSIQTPLVAPTCAPAPTPAAPANTEDAPMTGTAFAAAALPANGAATQASATNNSTPSAGAVIPASTDAGKTSTSGADVSALSPAPEAASACAAPPATHPAPASKKSADIPAAVPVDPVMLEMFRAEAEERLNTLNEQILRLEENPTDASRLEELMRAAHSLKGAARIIGLHPVVTLAHVLEDHFVAAQRGELIIRPEHADHLLAAADGLARLCSGSETSPDPYLLRLAALTAGNPSSAPAAPGTSASPDAHSEHKPAVSQPAVPAPEQPAQAPDAATNAADACSPPATSGACADAGAGQDVTTGQAAAGVRTAGQSPEPADGIVRVSAGSIGRILGLAGETVVQAQSMESLTAGVRQLRRSVEQQLELLDRLQPCADCAGAPLLQRLRAATVRTQELLQRNLGEVSAITARASDLSDRLYREVLTSRMRPFREGVQGLERMVRDLARQLGKRVRFEILGLDTRVDRDVLAKLEAPLTHLLRNAVDHGMQTPQERQAAGKPEENRLTLQALHWAGFLTVRISDDGRGIDLEAIRRKILQKQLHDPSTLPDLTPAELIEFLFLPGFTTTQQVSEISGRGVGLDVVREMLRVLGGQVQVENRPGHGVAFNLRLPVTRSVARMLLVEVAGEPYALPLGRIDRLLRVLPAAVRRLEGRAYVQDNGENIALVDAARLLELPAARAANQRMSVVVVRTGDELRGLVVDAFLGERELVVKPLDPRLGKIRDIHAVLVLDDGRIVLMLDVDDLAVSLRAHPAAVLTDVADETGSRTADAAHASAPAHQAVAARAGTPSATGKRVLVVDDSLTVREMERRLLEGAGYAVTTAVDGVDGWLNARAQPFDLLISDIDMPRMTGLELVRNLRADPQFAHLPVLLLSYKDRPEDHAAGFAAGANAYATKGGFQDGAFLRTVHDLLQGIMQSPENKH